MKTALDWVYESFHDLLAADTLIIEPRPDKFRRHAVRVRDSWLTVTSEGGYQRGHQYSYKFTRLQSGLVDIVALVVYPISDTEQRPLFICELVVVGDKIHIAVLDVETLAAPALEQRVVEVFGPLQERFTDQIPNADELPQWFEEIRSPVYMLSSAPLEDMSIYQDAFSAYWSQYRAAFPVAEDRVLVPEESSRVMAYKRHHDRNSPAKKVMSRFDDDWFEVFMRDYHFGPVLFETPRLSDRLRLETRSLHCQLEKNPVMGFYREPPHSCENYQKALLGLHRVHAVVEAQCRAFLEEEMPESPSQQELFRKLDLQGRCRLHLIQRDLQALDVPIPDTALLHGEDSPSLLSADTTERLLGYLYVLEGSTLGARVVVKYMLKNGWEPAVLNYYLGYRQHTDMMWEAFRESLDQAGLDEEAVITAARDLFGFMDALFAQYAEMPLEMSAKSRAVS